VRDAYAGSSPPRFETPQLPRAAIPAAAAEFSHRTRRSEGERPTHLAWACGASPAPAFGLFLPASVHVSGCRRHLRDPRHGRCWPAHRRDHATDRSRGV